MNHHHIDMAKIGANEPCHCGSGKKYKKCHRDQDEGKGGRWTPSSEEAAGILQHVRRMQREAEAAKYEAPPYQEVELGGQRLRFVGKGIYPERQSGQLCETVVRHFKSQVLGEKWLEEEGRKPAAQRHVVMRWLAGWDELLRLAARGDGKPGDRTYVPLTGETQELIALADDACRILQRENRFPKKLRERLLNRRQFQGARYELAVAATFIRCNFDVEWINDKTGPANKAGKRCEFNATHRVTGETVAVEAKSRHRQGALHEEGVATDAAGLPAEVDGLYKKAVEKNPEDNPFAIFIDVNLPHQPERQNLDKTWVAEVRETLEQYAKANPGEPVPFSFLFVTNFAWHYRGGNAVGSSENFFYYRPDAPFQVAWETFDAIGHAVRKYGKLPSGYLRTGSNQPLPVPERAHHVTVDLTVMTNSQSRAMSGSGRTLGQGYRPSYDAPNMEPQPVEIPVKEGAAVGRVIGVWYEPVKNAEGLDGFERMDVAPRTDEHKTTHFDLLASSRRGVATEVKIRVHIIYEGAQ